MPAISVLSVKVQSLAPSRDPTSQTVAPVGTLQEAGKHYQAKGGVIEASKGGTIQSSKGEAKELSKGGAIEASKGRQKN